MDFYNDIDPVACEWIRELIRDRLIPEGVVDERSIADIPAGELVRYRRNHFFAGISGWPLALRLAGWPKDAEVWTGSCPCPPFSSAGKKKRCPACGGKGVVPCPRRTGHFICVSCEHAWHADARHLWPEFWRLIAERRPAIVVGEQVAGKDAQLWYAGVRLTLEAIRYCVGAADLCAAGVGETQIVWFQDGDDWHRSETTIGPPHIRQRIFWVAVRRDVWERSRGVGQPGGLANTGHRIGGRAGECEPRPIGPAERHEVPVDAERCGGTGDSGVGHAAGMADTGRLGVRTGGFDVGGSAGGIGGEVREQRVRNDAGDGGDSGGTKYRWPFTWGIGFGRPTFAECGGGRLGDTGRQLGERRVAGGSGGCDVEVGVGPVELGRHGSHGVAHGGTVGDTGSTGREVGECDSRVQRAAGRPPAGQAAVLSGDTNFWAASDLIPCRDGKWRRIPAGSAEPHVLGVVDGLPRVLGGGGVAGGGHGEGSFPLSFEKVEGRNAALKGIGNAICPQVAAMFVSVVMEILGIQPEYTHGQTEATGRPTAG